MPKKLTMQQILNRLMDLATHGASTHSPFICADLVDQEELFDIQEALGKLIADMADGMGPKHVRTICTRMPYIFSVKETTNG